MGFLSKESRDKVYASTRAFFKNNTAESVRETRTSETVCAGEMIKRRRKNDGREMRFYSKLLLLGAVFLLTLKQRRLENVLQAHGNKVDEADISLNEISRTNLIQFNVENYADNSPFLFPPSSSRSSITKQQGKRISKLRRREFFFPRLEG